MARFARAFGRFALATAILAAGLAGCSRDQNTPGDRMFDLLRGRITGGDETGTAPIATPTREQLNQIPQATIGFTYGESPTVYMIPLADNGGYLTYQDAAQRGVVMFGGAVAGTLGLGNDLMTVRHALDDPIAHLTPVAEWPDSVVRTYEYRVRDVDEYIITVACELEQVRRVYYEIVELTYNVIRVVERCRNAVREFENTYWVEDSGFVRASEQWLGPDLPPATIEIVRRYGG